MLQHTMWMMNLVFFCFVLFVICLTSAWQSLKNLVSASYYVVVIAYALPQGFLYLLIPAQTPHTSQTHAHSQEMTYFLLVVNLHVSTFSIIHIIHI